MSLTLNPVTGKLDIKGAGGSSSFPASGGTFTGDVEFPSTGFVMNSETKRWRITMDDTGAFVSSEIIGANSGSPVGLLLTLTYP